MLLVGWILFGIIIGINGQAPELVGYHYTVNLTDTLISVADLTPAPSYFQLYYSVEGSVIHFGLVADTLAPNGWVGFGISPTGQMQGSDAAVIMTNATGAYVEDFILITTLTPGYPCDRAPCPDLSQTSCTNSFSSIKGYRQGNFTVAEWTRSLTKADGCDLTIQTDVAVWVVYAVGKLGTTYPWPYNLLKHDSYVDTYSNNNQLVFNSTVPQPTATQPLSSTGTTHVVTQASTTGAASTGMVTATTTGMRATTGHASVTSSNQNSGDTSSSLVYSLTALLLAVMMLSFGF